MKSLRFDKLFITQRICENRKLHEEIYNEAMVGFKAKVIETLSLKLEKFKDSATENLYIHLPVPLNHLKEYDRALLMLGQCLDVELELDEKEYSQYIQDNWTWSQQFLTSNSSYSSMAASGCANL